MCLKSDRGCSCLSQHLRLRHGMLRHKEEVHLSRPPTARANSRQLFRFPKSNLGPTATSAPGFRCLHHMDMPGKLDSQLDSWCSAKISLGMQAPATANF